MYINYGKVTQERILCQRKASKEGWENDNFWRKESNQSMG